MQYSDISRTIVHDRDKIAKLQGLGNDLGFGKERSSHVFLMNFEGMWEKKREGEWSNPRIVPYLRTLKSAEVPLTFGSKIIHYGYGIFEGAKAFLHPDNELYTFRLKENALRQNKSARMLEMPIIPEDDYHLAVHSLLDIDREYYPQRAQGGSLYVRSFLFGTSDELGVKPGNNFTFGIFLSPSGPYYDKGFDPITLIVQPYFFRAGKGGVGAAKAAGNYASAARAARLAELVGCEQTLFLDPVHNKYVDEVGTSAFGMFDGETFRLTEVTDTILDSISAKSAEAIVPRYNLAPKVIRSRISINKVREDLENKIDLELFGMGTAALISPIRALRFLRESAIDLDVLRKVRCGELRVDSLISGDPQTYYDEILIGNGDVGNFTQRLFETYTGIQTGHLTDTLGFLDHVKRRV